MQIHSQDAVAQTDFVTDAWKPAPRAGAVYDLARGVSVFADYSQSLRGVPFFNAGTAPKPEHWKKYRRSAMENRRHLQCKALQRREKRRLSKNIGKQWKNNAISNAKNNGNNETRAAT